MAIPSVAGNPRRRRIRGQIRGSAVIEVTAPALHTRDMTTSQLVRICTSRSHELEPDSDVGTATLRRYGVRVRNIAL